MFLFVFLKNQRVFFDYQVLDVISGVRLVPSETKSPAYSLQALSQQRRGSFPPSQRPSLKTLALNSVRSERGAPVGEEILVSYN